MAVGGINKKVAQTSKEEWCFIEGGLTLAKQVTANVDTSSLRQQCVQSRHNRVGRVTGHLKVFAAFMIFAALDAAEGQDEAHAPKRRREALRDAALGSRQHETAGIQICGNDLATWGLQIGITGRQIALVSMQPPPQKQQKQYEANEASNSLIQNHQHVRTPASSVNKRVLYAAAAMRPSCELDAVSTSWVQRQVPSFDGICVDSRILSPCGGGDEPVLYAAMNRLKDAGRASEKASALGGAILAQ
eukprot:CAMPEP_0119399206 /NCGR_PEP_ID=MMETSP1334-20130426/141241_1 /TAXON_ID=127549 /ORGANISM="Calcidiscus leptoporus, Strain RCC1130" /LENGTH=245 /DNA_ID=CAMNT_0007423091 /DNA_START=465 /DNA_END=1205 /DNA_ORIENTATION=+